VFKVEFRSVTEVGVRENSSEEASLGLHYFESVAARPSAVSNAMRAVKEPQCGATSPCANRPPAFTGVRPLIVIISTAQSDIAGLPRN